MTWVDIDEPDPDYAAIDDPRGVFQQGFAKGGALFNRLEGCWEDHGRIFFVSTSGGDAKNGDVNRRSIRGGLRADLEVPPRRWGGTLELVYESPGAAQLDSPDNLTVTPRGGLIVCEDDASSKLVDTHRLAPGIENVNRLIGIDRGGDAFEFAVNVLNGSELAGCCFSPERPHAVLQHLRAGQLQRGPRRGDDLRGDRPVEARAALVDPNRGRHSGRLVAGQRAPQQVAARRPGRCPGSRR